MAIVGLFIAELVYATGGNERWHAADKAEKVESTLSNQILPALTGRHPTGEVCVPSVNKHGMQLLLQPPLEATYESLILRSHHHNKLGKSLRSMNPTVWIEKVLDKGQPCEQAGFRKGFDSARLTTFTLFRNSSRYHESTRCRSVSGITRVQDAFIDLKKAFDSAETEAVVEALDNQGVPTQYIKVLRELYSNFTTGISPFYKNIIIDVKRGVRQGDTISPKIFTATLENAMRKLEWDDMGVKIDGRQLHHLRFADDIVLITPSISQAERMLTEFDETCGYIGLQLNLQKMMFMRNDGSRMPHSRSTERTHPNAPATFIWVGN
ncbi:hypothetical protein RB195_019846 [Necator americanus]|uniref:Reverse transcriptase domain-containing protein n=1 Tax=Necator americanus TaxID=51031 RepID=A0ABR1CG14_NECAM